MQLSESWEGKHYLQVVKMNSAQSSEELFP